MKSVIGKFRILNIFLTVFILCLPILREQYNNGQYVTWYRPLILFISYLQRPAQIQPFFVMMGLVLVVYFIVSVVVAVISKLIERE